MICERVCELHIWLMSKPEMYDLNSYFFPFETKSDYFLSELHMTSFDMVQWTIDGDIMSKQISKWQQQQEVMLLTAKLLLFTYISGKYAESHAMGCM